MIWQLSVAPGQVWLSGEFQPQGSEPGQRPQLVLSLAPGARLPSTESSAHGARRPGGAGGGGLQAPPRRPAAAAQAAEEAGAPRPLRSWRRRGE